MDYMNSDEFAVFYQEHICPSGMRIIDFANAEYTPDGGETWRKCVRLKKKPWDDERFPQLKDTVPVVLANGTHWSVLPKDIREIEKD